MLYIAIVECFYSLIAKRKLAVIVNAPVSFPSVPMPTTESSRLPSSIVAMEAEPAKRRCLLLTGRLFTVLAKCV